jgi:hypothetical protein
MLKHYNINQRVIIKNLKYIIDTEINYETQQSGYIKGVKISPINPVLYLIELLNYNRIWVVAHEVKSCYK